MFILEKPIANTHNLRFYARNDNNCPSLLISLLRRVMRKPTFWFPTWSDTNQAVQLQKMARGLKFFRKRDRTIYVAKTKALISLAVTAKLICVFVFAYAKCWFSHDAAQMILDNTVFILFSAPAPISAPQGHFRNTGVQAHYKFPVWGVRDPEKSQLTLMF